MTANGSAQEGIPTERRHSEVTAAVGGAGFAHVAGACGLVAGILARVGDKWTMLVVMMLEPGELRFNEIRRRVDGISQRMLTVTLRGLERDGLVSRTVTPSTPPRVDYALTALGHSLARAVHVLGEWALTHRGPVEAARQAFDERAVAAAHKPPAGSTRMA